MIRTIIILLISMLIIGCGTKRNLTVKEYKNIEVYKKNEKLIKSLVEKQLKKNLSEEEKVYMINQYFSVFPYVEDTKNYNKKDYWATEEEFYANYGGDCEDIAFVKYKFLIKKGINPNNLDFIKGRVNGGLHIVLRYKSIDKYLVLETNGVIGFENYIKSNYFEVIDIYDISFFLFLQRVNRMYNYFVI